MMYSYVVSKTLNLPLRSWGTKARLAAGEPCEGEKTHMPQPPSPKALVRPRTGKGCWPSPTWPSSSWPSLDSTPTAPPPWLHRPRRGPHAGSREVCRPWVACSLHLHLPHSWWATSSASRACLLLGPHSGHCVSHTGAVHGDHSLRAAPASPWLANLSGSLFQAHCSWQTEVHSFPEALFP